MKQLVKICIFYISISNMGKKNDIPAHPTYSSLCEDDMTWHAASVQAMLPRIPTQISYK